MEQEKNSRSLSLQRRVNYLLGTNRIPKTVESSLPTSDMVESSENENNAPNGTSTENTSSLGGNEKEKETENYEKQVDEEEEEEDKDKDNSE